MFAVVFVTESTKCKTPHRERVEKYENKIKSFKSYHSKVTLWTYLALYTEMYSHLST